MNYSSETLHLKKYSNGNTLQIYYTSVNSGEKPEAPEGFDPSNPTSGWQPQMPLQVEGKDIYMIQKLSNEAVWSNPIQISGKNGLPGTSLYTLTLSNDYAVFPPNSYESELIHNLTYTRAQVYHGEEPVAQTYSEEEDGAYYVWDINPKNVEGEEENWAIKHYDGTGEGIVGSELHFDQIYVDMLTATVTAKVRKNGEIITELTRQYTLYSKRDGEDSVYYKMNVTPNQIKKGEDTDITIEVIKTEGKNSTVISSGYQIKYGEKTWDAYQNKNEKITINDTTTFELKINDFTWDKETVEALSDGTSPYLIDLSNNSDVVSVANGSPINLPETRVLCFAGKELQEDASIEIVTDVDGYNYNYTDGTFKLTLIPEAVLENKKGVITFVWYQGEKTNVLATKNFTFTLVNSSVDYNLNFNKNVVKLNGTEEQRTIHVQIEKWDTNGLTFYGVGTEGMPTVQSCPSGTNEWSDVTEGEILIDVPTDFRLVENPGVEGEEFIWDHEHIETVADGLSTYTISLSNNAATVSADAYGNVDQALLRWSSKTQVKVFYGETDITNECSFKWSTEPSDERDDPTQLYYSEGSTENWLTAMAYKDTTIIVEAYLEDKRIGKKFCKITKVNSPVAYKLYATPNQIKKGENTKIKIEAVRCKNDGTVEQIPHYSREIKMTDKDGNTTTILSKSEQASYVEQEIQESATFSLWIRGDYDSSIRDYIWVQWDSETVDAVKDGVDAFSIIMSQSSAVVAVNPSGEIDPEELREATETFVYVYQGEDDITSDCTFEWEGTYCDLKYGKDDDYSHNWVTGFTDNHDTAVMEVDVRHKRLGYLGNKNVIVAKANAGVNAYTYKLVPSQRKIRKGESTTITFDVYRIDGPTRTLLTEGYEIKYNENTIQNNSASISDTTEFVLYVNDEKWDSEVVEVTSESVTPLMATRIFTNALSVGGIRDTYPGGNGASGSVERDLNRMPRVGETFEAKAGSNPIMLQVFEITELSGETQETTGPLAGKTVHEYKATVISSSSYTGPQGNPGSDGQGIEFVYYLTNNIFTQTNTSWPPRDANGNLINNWSQEPSGVAEDKQYEYVSTCAITTDENGNLERGTYSTPAIWSKWGKKGQDGAGIKYYFCRNNTGTPPKYGEGTWTDEPQGVSSSMQYEYVVQVRIINGVEENTQNKEGKLWSKWANDSTVPGPSGTQGTKTESIRIYQANTSTTPPDAPTETDSLGSWTATDPGVNSTTNIYLWSCTGVKTTTYNDNGTANSPTYGSWTTPELYKAYIEKVDPFSAAEYYKITNFGTKDAFGYGTDGNMYVNATYINTGALTVKKGGDGTDKNEVIFSAGWDANNMGKVEMAGWEVTNNYIRRKSKSLGSEGSMYLSPTGITNQVAVGNLPTDTWAIAIADNFGVTTTGNIHSTAGNIAGWEIATNSITTKDYGLGKADSFHMYSEGYKTTDASSSKTYFGQSLDKTWCLGIGENFGVTKKGELYCGSGAIGTWQITKGVDYDSISGGKIALYGNGSSYGRLQYPSLVTSNSVSMMRITSGGSITGHKTSTSTKTSETFTKTENATRTTRTVATASSYGISYIADVTSTTKSGTGEVLILGWGHSGKNAIIEVDESNLSEGGQYSLSVKYCPWESGGQPTFMILDDGSLYASAANISGTISASKGDIAGWLIDAASLEKISLLDTSSTYYPYAIILKTNVEENQDALILGQIDNNKKPLDGAFRVTNSGQCYISSGKIGHFSIEDSGLSCEDNSGRIIMDGFNIYTSRYNLDSGDVSRVSQTKELILTHGSSVSENAGAIMIRPDPVNGNIQTTATIYRSEANSDIYGAYFVLRLQSATNFTPATVTVYWANKTKNKDFDREKQSGTWNISPNATIKLGNEYLALGGKYQTYEKYGCDFWKEDCIGFSLVSIDDAYNNAVNWGWKIEDNDVTKTLGTVYCGPAAGDINYSVQVKGHLLPYLGNCDIGTTRDLTSATGRASKKWRNIYLKGVCYENDSTSDLRVKNSISSLPIEYELFFDKMEPTRYKYNNGTSNRYHTGFVAQQLVSALEESNLTTQDFAGVMLLAPGTENECWYLRRDEFVALNTWQIQKLKPRVSALEQTILNYESRISALEAEIQNLKS